MTVHKQVLAALARADISPCIAVPCRHFMDLLLDLQGEPDRMLIYPAREEEGLGICAGAYLAGRFPIMIIQNSGLGNLVNAYCALNQFYSIPVFFLVSYRGDHNEKIAAQCPMGKICQRLLDLMDVENFVLDDPGQAPEILDHLQAYRAGRRSRAILLRPTFWKG